MCNQDGSNSTLSPVVKGSIMLSINIPCDTMLLLNDKFNKSQNHISCPNRSFHTPVTARFELYP